MVGSQICYRTGSCCGSTGSDVPTVPMGGHVDRHARWRRSMTRVRKAREYCEAQTSLWETQMDSARVLWERAEYPMDLAALEGLCADRKLVTCEVVYDNACYGIASIIKRWAGMPLDRPLMIALPHGVEGDAARPFSHHELVPVIASYRRDASRPYRAMPISRLWYMASPYVHVVSMLEGFGASRRKGSIFFPQHSITTYSVDYDVEYAIDQLRALPVAYQPVTICLYWVDVLRGMHRAYIDAGFDVTSCGHMYDPLFLYRMHRLCANHKFTIHHDFGSAVVFSIKSGCRAVVIDGKPRWLATGDWNVPDPNFERENRMSRERDMVHRMAEMSTDAQLAWADQMLGTSLLRSRDETAAMIRRAERLDRFGCFAERGLTGRRNPLTMPTMYRRAARRVVPMSVRRPLRPIMMRLRTHGSD